MIPILYQGTETNFTSNGLGRLADAISCKVTEERNGVFELEMEYPITGVHYTDIAENCIILAKTEDGGTPQAFIIYKITKPLNGIITINAEHISYLLNGIPVMPFSASSLVETMSNIANHAVITCPFTFYTDISSAVNFSLTTPRSIRSLLGGESGSILDVYGGYDYKFDNFTVKLLANRGVDHGVTLRYGKNLTELKNITNMTNVYTGIVPYWQSEHDTVYLDSPVVYSGHQNDYPYKIIKTVDFSSDFEEKPTQAQLLARAERYLNNNKGWTLKNNITVSFVNLADTEDYKNVAVLQRVKLCDTVHITYQRLGVDVSARVVKTVYNVLLDKYDSLELGEATTDLIKAINETVIEQGDVVSKGFLQAAIENATRLIQGGLGGHVVFNTNADGEPQEILIMDTDDINTAVSVIRMNKNGIGFSTNGYSGPFLTAWTIDGSFYADFITAGTLNANLIKAGIIKDVANTNYWNMVTGEFRLSTGAQIGDSTIASNADVSGAVDDYDTALNQQKVFNKLTNNGALQGIYMQNGNLYINGSYIKTGVLDAGLITAGILKDANNLNSWNLATGAFQLSSNATVGNSTNKVASASSVSTAINNYDTSLGQQQVFNKLTENGTKQGITLDANTGNLYINATYIATGILAGANGKFALNMETGAFTMKDGTLSGVNIQSDDTGARLKLDNTTSIKGYYSDTMHNLINFEQVVSGSHQMTIDADTQLNIRTPHVYVTNQSAGTGTAIVYETITDNPTGASDSNPNYYLVKNLGKYAESEDPLHPTVERWVKTVSAEDATQWDVFCTLPVYLKFDKAPLRYINGMLVGTGTAQSIII